MSTLINPARPPTLQRRPSRIVERTTTITREFFLDDPTPTAPAAGSASQYGPGAADQMLTAPAGLLTTPPAMLTTPAEIRLHGLNRAMVRLGVWLIEAGRRHALRPSASADEIARRVDAAKAHDMRHFIGLPN